MTNRMEGFMENSDGSSFRIAVCDDVALERDILHDMLQELSPNAHIVGFSSGEELLLSDMTFDLIFLDIFMGGLNGMETAKKLRERNCRAKIVFLTSSPDYAVESYEVLAFDYILKPIRPERLESVCKCVFKEEKPIKRIVLRSADGVQEVSVDQLECIESSGHYLVFHLSDKRTIRIYGKLDDMEEKLSDPDFIRCHQSMLVNMHFIARMEDTFLMKSGLVVPYRKRGVKTIREQYEAFLQKV